MQEVERLTDALVKDSKKFEKEEVGLQEKKKHLTTKQKKSKKSLTDVSVLQHGTCIEFTVVQDGHARSEALSAVQNYEADLDSNRAKITGLEEKLIVEEAELEEIRDSLKGEVAFDVVEF